MASPVTLDLNLARIYANVARLYPSALWTRTNATQVSTQLFGPPRLSLPTINTEQSLPTVAERLLDQSAQAWNTLALHFVSSDDVLPHIHALSFFLQPLSYGRKLLFRGQSDASWALETTLARSLRRGMSLESIRDAKARYVERLHQLEDRRHLVLAGAEPEALCQHYGFPTDYLDFTWSLEVAGFFALGGNDRYSRPADLANPAGAIWVLDVMGATDQDGIELVSLPAQVMRPWLQRGEFLNAAKLRGVPSPVRVAKLSFQHDPDIWIDTLSDLGPFSVAPLSMFLLPRRDPLESAARPFLDTLAKETRT